MTASNLVCFICGLVFEFTLFVIIFITLGFVLPFLILWPFYKPALKRKRRRVSEAQEEMLKRLVVSMERTPELWSQTGKSSMSFSWIIGTLWMEDPIPRGMVFSIHSFTPFILFSKAKVYHGGREQIFKLPRRLSVRAYAAAKKIKPDVDSKKTVDPAEVLFTMGDIGLEKVENFND